MAELARVVFSNFWTWLGTWLFLVTGGLLAIFALMDWRDRRDR